MITKLKSYDPSNGELVGEVDVTSIDDIASIVEKAHTAQKEWGALSVNERIEYIGKAGKALSERAQELGKLLSREMGKDISRGNGEVYSCASDAVYRAKEVQEAIKTQFFRGGRRETQMQYNPLGVCAIIAPWNYPMSMAHWMIIPALTAGNTVVFKPSEETPLIAQAYVETFNKVLPDGVLQIVHGAEEQGKALVLADVNLIGFTGSRPVGKDIMRNAAGTLKRLVMELGGKDPLIVMNDADIRQAAYFAVANSLENAGQMCIATERIYVDEKVADEFEKELVNIAGQYKVGAWNDIHADVGPIINDKQRSIILSHIEDAIDKGARVLLGGKDHPGRYILPTVLADIKPDMLIANEETFGPVICISRYKDIDEAVKSANNSDFGLGASVYGGDQAEEVANRLEAGMVGINQGVGGIGDTPWVGAKQSGFGYHGSPDGHRQFTQVRVVTKRG
ncbi:aldehyde dehydrogenase family protein [Carboxylicivirga sp. RSCT41]|uniref:aldehyde dehydrogenase family protein n=1 Tax=Carboxylicivirga agarovorans TaxID=3417570 RepID=UPI003D33B6A4